MYARSIVVSDDVLTSICLTHKYGVNLLHLRPRDHVQPHSSGGTSCVFYVKCSFLF